MTYATQTNPAGGIAYDFRDQTNSVSLTHIDTDGNLNVTGGDIYNISQLLFSDGSARLEINPSGELVYFDPNDTATVIS